MKQVKVLSDGLSLAYDGPSDPACLPWGEITVVALSSSDTPAGIFRRLVVDHESGHYFEIGDEAAGFHEVLQDLHRYLPGVRTDLNKAFAELAADGDLEVYRRKDLQ